MPVSLSDQITALEALPQSEAISAAVKTLKLMMRFESKVRDTIRAELEREKLSKHPAVRQVLDAFPGSEIGEVRDV